MKYWQSLSFTEPEDLLPIARKAEEVGFEGAFMSDHVWHPVPHRFRLSLFSRTASPPSTRTSRGRTRGSPSAPWPP